MVNNEGYNGITNICLEGFEGPYDLLLTLIEKNKVSIMDVSISLIADQYLDVLNKSFDMEIATEFLYMASVLLHIKSRTLLPKPPKEEVEISEEELRQRLVLYKKYKEIAPLFAEKLTYWEGSLYKMPEQIKFPKIYKPVTLDPIEINEIYEGILQKNEAKKNDNKTKMEQILTVEKVSLKEKMRQVVRNVIKKAKTKFSDIFSKSRNTKMEIVTGFLAVLELDRRKSVRIEQEKNFGEIIIIKGENNDQDISFDSFDETQEYD